MKRIFPLGLLALLAIGYSSIEPAVSTQKVKLAETSAPGLIAQSTSSPNSRVRRQTPQGQNVYRSTRFGISFNYSKAYVVDNSDENRQPKPGETLQGAIALWHNSDYQALKRHNFQGSEPPPNISISVYSNPQRLPLSQLKDTLSIGSTNARTITVAGQNAIAYTSDGLYASDNVLLASPDGQRVIRLSRGYLNASDPSQQVFQQVVSSFRFNN
ncbi:MAG TPA: hypothetical protein V6D50_19985 [Chroococcales cyanobacterium]|jgi:hypothetical protein